MADVPHPLLHHAYITWKPVHPISFIYSTMHIYLFQIDPTPPQNEHRSLENHYTIAVSYITQCISTHGRTTPSATQSNIDALNTTTSNLAYLLTDLPPNHLSIYPLIYQYTTLGRSTGRSTSTSNKHSCLEYCGPIAESICSLRTHAKLSAAS